MKKPKDHILLVNPEEWAKLDAEQKQFIWEADAGHFCYYAENGKVMAWGARKTSNLFSMAVDEEETPEGSNYTLQR